MMRELLSTGLVFLGLFGTSFGGHSGPPTQQMIRVQPDGQLQVYYQVMMCIPETATRTVQEKVPVTKEVQEDVNGEIRKKLVTDYQIEERTIQFTVTKTVCEMKVRQVRPDQVKAFETDGRAISLKQLAQRAGGDTLVVISPTDEMIPDYYATIFKPGTIILALEQEPAYPAPMPAHPALPIEPPAGEVKAPQSAQSGTSSSLLRFVSQPGGEDDAVELRIPQHAPAPSFPSTLAPLFVFASREGTDRFKVRQMTEHSFEQTGYKVRKQGTGKQMVPLTMMQTVRHNEITTISGEHLHFFAGEGTPLALDRVKEKLSRETTVLYSADGEEIDPFWLQNLKSTALAIVGPQLPGGCGGSPMGYGGYAVPMPAPVFAPGVEAAPPSPPQAAPAPAPAEAE